MSERVDVVLVVPPFASIVMPMLGPSLLKMQLERRGIRAQVVYANLAVARAIGFRAYQNIADSDVRSLHGERLCAMTDSGWRTQDPNPTDQQSLPPEPLSHLIDPLRNAMHEAAVAIAGLGPEIVGFSSTFQQNVASILITRHLRRLLPSAVLVIGGANVDAPMGMHFHHTFGSEFDHVFSGEADVVFPAFCEDVLKGIRQGWRAVVECAPVSAKDFQGVPDFTDYFEAGGKDAQRELTGERIVPFEVSRGCWWGEKNHCLFCGLNANGMAHRVKAYTVVESEIDVLRRHQPTLLFATDNILPKDAARRGQVLHSAGGIEFRFFFETKSNLNADDLDALVRMGIWSIQPGIESFSTSVLRSLRKGNTGPQHLCLLREAASRQIHVTWNLLVDVPHDDAAEYRAMLDLFTRIKHLQPPTGCTPIRIDRYSPYFMTPALFDISCLRPTAAFTALYGNDPAAAEMCYFFEGDYPSAFRNTPGLREAVENSIDAWKRSWSEPNERRTLVGLRNRSGSYVIIDQTGGHAPLVTSVPAEHESLLFRTKRPLAASSLSVGEEAVLASYVARGVLALFEQHYVYLPTEPEQGFRLREGQASERPAGPLSLPAYLDHTSNDHGAARQTVTTQ
jgi:ribosomal peptide maturation radical SAM protein 1